MSSNPHDALFKATFRQPDLARSELELVLPPEVRSLLDLATLEVCPGSFVDPELQQAHSDLLFRVQTNGGDESFVYVLVEHQSSPDGTMPFRLLRYMVRIWERWLEDHRGVRTLPIIVPVLLHHGDAPWATAPELEAMLAAPSELVEATRPFVPHFRFLLDDLMRASAAELANRSLAPLPRLVQLALWASRSFTRLESAKGFMREIVAALARDRRTRTLLEQVFRYMIRTSPADIERETMTAILLEVAGPEGREGVLNLEERLIEQGRVEGLRAGIFAILRTRGIALTDSGHSRIEACANPNALTRWLSRAATAASEDEIFATDR